MEILKITNRHPSTSALIVVDIQKGLTQRKGIFQEQLFVDSVNKAIFSFRKTYSHIVFVQHNNKFLKANSPDWEIDDRIDCSMLDYSIQKQHADAFRNTGLDLHLRDRGVTDVYICGLASHSCIKYTCFGGLAHGFATYLIRNAHSCFNKNAEELIRQTEEELVLLGIHMVNTGEL
jgi:nicotinamidase-related amidase